MGGMRCTEAGTMQYTLTQPVQSWEGKQSEEDTSHTCFIQPKGEAKCNDKLNPGSSIN